MKALDDRTESEYEKGGSSLSELPHDANRMREEDERADHVRLAGTQGGPVDEE